MMTLQDMREIFQTDADALNTQRQIVISEIAERERLLDVINQQLDKAISFIGVIDAETGEARKMQEEQSAEADC